MHVFSLKALKDFWGEHAEAEEPLKAWYAEAKKASWNAFSDIQERYPSADQPVNRLVIFNIKGNKYRLVVKVQYQAKMVFVKFVGTHAEYSKINVEELS